ncbi:hypothetical protein CFE70_003664 [Pyrenophora teres f. teres 0-1]|nr:hypothetical protein HRS9139_00443 [Pyrenophora teres f. teres]KAE8872706.1 hypothetical protein PTNB73_01857 [Pyrenophora teres f. teres]
MSMISQTLQGAVLSITSNVLAQAISSYQDSTPFALNYNQVLQFALFSILSNPPNIIWQGFLEDQFPTNVPSAAVASDKPTSSKPPPRQASAKQMFSSSLSSIRPSALL